MKKQKNSSEFKKHMRLTILERVFGRKKGIKSDAANELADELEISGPTGVWAAFHLLRKFWRKKIDKFI